MKIPMRNPKTGDFREVKVGWSWTLFLFSGIFGLPLFLRRLNVWGGIFLMLWLVNVLAPLLMSPIEATISTYCLLAISIGLQTFFGLKGNEMTAKNYLERDWVFVDPNSETTRIAKASWGISL